MRLPPLRSMLFCLALLAASGHALASESRQSAADEACPDTSVASTADRTDESPVDEPATPVRQTQKAKPAASASPRVTGGARSNPPRFHSFLPGMFR